MNRKTFGCQLAVLFVLSLAGATSLSAQQKGQYLPGQFGLNAGVMPDPGFTYASININYDATTLKDPNGNTIPTSGSYDLWAVESVFFYEPNFNVLGGKLVSDIIAPTFANGSVAEETIGFQAGGFGVADIFVQPATLSWKLKHADLWVSDGFVAPTGRYSPGASDNIGSGYWGNQFMTGSTVYLTKNKGTTANPFTDWEAHGSKQTSITPNLRETPGGTFTMEWGFGQVLPLDKQFSKLLQVGLVGYDQWQVTSNSGFQGTGAPASVVPFYSVHAIGFQTNLILPAKSLNFYFKYEPEYSAKARVEGTTIAFGGSYTFRIPKPRPKS